MNGIIREELDLGANIPIFADFSILIKQASLALCKPFEAADLALFGFNCSCKFLVTSAKLVIVNFTSNLSFKGAGDGAKSQISFTH